MATTTPNYLWSVPTSSDLVKNGATAIETLGDSVDASLWNSGYGQAGKNKIINGDMNIWQRGTSITSNSGSWVYSVDRFQTYMTVTTGTCVISQQTFTPGTAPVAGYEGTYFMRATAPTTGSSGLNFRQSIENVRTLAGQSVTFSFWAKASATTAGKMKLTQNFGSGGSASVDSALTSVSFTTSWARYSMSVTLGSVSGKTIGTSSFLDAYYYTDSNFSSAATIDFWGVQVEYGLIATPFQTATGTIQGELAACQRYLPAIFTNSASEIATGYNVSTTQPFLFVSFQVPARVAPTGITATAANYAVRNTGGTPVALTAIAYNNASVVGAALLGTVASGLVAGQGTTATLNGTLLFTGCEL